MDVSEVRAVSILSVVLSFTLEMQAAGSSEKCVPLYQTTWRHIPKDRRAQVLKRELDSAVSR
jgi:hypothetical protein